MNTNKITTELEDMKISVKMKLSALWAAVMFCFIYGDILYNYQFLISIHRLSSYFWVL